MPEVLPVAEARAELTRMLQRFRDDPLHAEPVVLGSRRVPEAVMMPYARYRELTDASPMPRSPRAALHERRDVIERLARASRLADVRVFGSIARGDDRPESDVDLLVTPDAEASLFDLARFGLDVEAIVGRHVDVVSRRALDPVRDADILAEARPL